MNNFITVVIPIYKRPECVHIICNAFLVQTDPSWNLMLVNDGQGDQDIDKVARHYAEDPRITYYAIPKGNCWGHNCRNFGLSMADSEWVVLSGHDNYYVPTFVESVESVLDRQQHQFDLIYWNMIHNYYKYNFSKAPESPLIDPSGPDPKFLPQTELMPTHVDIGSFAVRTSLVRTMQINESSAANDWIFLSQILRIPNLRIAKINRCLYVHN